MSRKKGNTSPLPGGGNKGGARGSKVCEDARHWLAEARIKTTLRQTPKSLAFMCLLQREKVDFAEQKTDEVSLEIQNEEETVENG